MTEFRTEKDSLGEVSVPAHALYGAHTQRAVENFHISGIPLPGGFISSLGLIKAAAARANADLGLLEPAMADGIAAAEIAKRAYREKRPILDVAAEMTDLPMGRLAGLLNPRNLV